MTVTIKRRATRIGAVSTFLAAIIEERKDEQFVYYYRGHGKASYELTPLVYRNEGWINNEDKLFQELILKCPDDFPRSELTFQTLVRMQHYSLPTRLLDLTASPLAALYFACKAEKDGKGVEDAEVVCFKVPKSEVKYFDSDTVSIISNLSRRPVSFAVPDIKNDESFNGDEDVRKLLHEIKKEKSYFLPVIKPGDLNKVICVKPKLDNPRVIRQNGAFLLFGMGASKSQCASFPEQYRYEPKGERVLINGSKKPRILKELESLGITESALFPEIESVAEEIKSIYEVEKVMEAD